MGTLVSFLRRHSLVLLVVLGAGLRIGLYLENRCLWADEARLALNILHKGPSELTGPLEFGQVAPPGFLLLVKAAERVFGGSELSLRLVPLLSALASLFLFARLAARRLRPEAAPLACLLFAIAEPLVFYSTELKQYSGDVAIALALWLLSEWAAEEPLRVNRFAALGLAGAAALFFSHTAIFVLGGVGLGLLVGFRPESRRRGLGGLALACLLWAAGMAALFAMSLHRVVADARLVRYFTELLEGFPPAGLLPAGRWLLGRLLELFAFPGALDRGGIPALCAVVGAAAIARRGRRPLVTWVAPILLALVAAALYLYPFGGRLVLFAVPAVYLLVAEGAEEIRVRTREGGGFLFGALLVLLLLHPVAGSLDGLKHPRNFEQVLPVLRHVSAARRAGDVVYLYYGSQYAVRYYLETREISLADVPSSELFAPEKSAMEPDWYAPALVTRPPSFFVGSKSRDNWLVYGRELDGLAGLPRVWIIFSHVNVWTGVDERRLFLEHLDGMGKRLDTFEENRASAFLYDLRALPPAGL